ncbi:T9SS type A sorting domain-containing protein [bacterium]|nr:T9SS type A sorting domain-containing protein [bacterium]
MTNVKTVYLTTVMLLLLSVGLYAGILETGKPSQINHIYSNENTIKLDYQGTFFEYFSVETDDCNYVKLSIPNAGVNTVIGEPELPVVRIYFQAPHSSEFEVEISNLEQETYDLKDLGIDFPVIPYQGPREKSRDNSHPFLINEKIYESNGDYFKEQAAVVYDGHIRGYKVGLLEIRPVNYNPALNRISVILNMEISIKLRNADIGMTYNNKDRYFSPYFDQLVKNILVNPEAYQLSWVPDIDVGYLIISADEYTDELEQLVWWKTRKGFKVNLKGVSEIGGTANAIRDYIISEYTSGDIPPDFVLLVGDVDEIPSFTGTAGRTESDLPFSLMDDSDYLPDIMVGRLSMDEPDQVEEFCQRIIRYEQFDWTDTDWSNAACFAASDDFINWSIAEGTHRYVIQSWLGSLGMDCDSIWAHSGGSGSDITTAVNAGRMILNYSGHGNETGWGGPDYSQGNVRALTNSQAYPFVISNACLTGSYAENECFGETWIRQHNKGAIAFLGGSNSTYWDEDDIMERTMYDAVFEEDYYILAGMTQQGLLAVNSTYPSSGDYYFDIYVLLGDPSLALFYGHPHEIVVTHPDRIPGGVCEVEISASIENALVSITNDDDLHFAGYTDHTGNAALEIEGAMPGDTLWVTVSAYNKIPYMGYMLVGSAEPWVIYSSAEIDDDDEESSLGDGDNVIDAGETVELTIELFNIGETSAAGVSGKLKVFSEGVTVTDSMSTFGTLSPEGGASSLTPYLISFSTELPDWFTVQCSLYITDSGDGSWAVRIPLSVRAPVLKFQCFLIDDYPPRGDGDGYPEGGESFEMDLRIKNSGGETARDILGKISVISDTFITIVADEASYGNVDPSGINSPSPEFEFTISEYVPRLHTVSVVLNMWSDGSLFTFVDTFQIEIKQGGFDDDVERGICGWDPVGWVIAENRHGSPSHSWYCGEPFFQQYPETLNAYLYSPVVTVTDSAILSFWHYYAVDYDDTCKVLVRLAGGGWRTFETFTGFSKGWKYESIDLSMYPRETLTQFMFMFKSNLFAQNEGWFIDDIYIGPPKIAELGGANVTPVAGDRHTEFSFEVNYRSSRNLEPTAVYLVIDDDNYFAMTSDDTTYNNGANFSFNTTLLRGFHEYYFYFETGDIILKFPKQGAFEGPYVCNQVNYLSVGISEAGITSGGGRNDWEWGVPTYGPASVPNGENCWGTNLDSDYSPLSRSKLVLPEFDLSGLNHPFLEVWQWYEMEPSVRDTFNDGGNVKLAIWDSAPFTIFPEQGYDGQQTSYNIFIPWEPGFGGDEYGTSWHKAVFDLSRFVGDNVTIYFEFGASPENQAPGWYINDIVLLDPPLEGIYPDEQDVSLPSDMLLLSSCPNPFNSSTIITYNIPARKNGTNNSLEYLTKLEIYDITGKKIRTLVNEPKIPGKHEIIWNGKDSENRNCSSGIYFIRISNGKENVVNKTLMIK